MLRIGVIGSGGIISKHIRHLAERKDAGIVALCDVDPKRIQATNDAFFKDHPVKGYATPKEMYGKGKLDAVIIATPHTLHYTHAVQALKAGCHVFLEKPMTTSSKDARKLAKIAEEANKIIAIGYNTACSRAFRYLRQLIRTEKMGKLEMVTGFLSQNWMKITTGLWRQDPALSGGGQAYDSGAHILNSLLWSVGSEPETVFALLDNKGCAVDINTVMSVRFANGVLANITISGNCATDGTHMAFIFENGLVEIDGWGGGWIKIKAKDVDSEIPADIEDLFPIINFVEAIQGKAEVAANVKNGINHSLLMDCIYASARTGKPITASKLKG